jgi:hypothetical protein
MSWRSRRYNAEFRTDLITGLISKRNTDYAVASLGYVRSTDLTVGVLYYQCRASLRHAQDRQLVFRPSRDHFDVFDVDSEARCETEWHFIAIQLHDGSQSQFIKILKTGHLPF